MYPYICNLLVSPKNRGRGYGKYLMQQCEEHVRKLGFRKIFLHVEPGSTAYYLYVRLGYTPILTVNKNVLFMSKMIEVTLS